MKLNSFQRIAVVLLSTVLMTGAARAQESAAANSAAAAPAPQPALTVQAGEDRDVIMPGKTYLNGFAGYRSTAGRRGGARGQRGGAVRHRPGGHSRLDQGFRPGRGHLRRRGQGGYHRHVRPNRRLRLVVHREQQRHQPLLHPDRAGG